MNINMPYFLSELRRHVLARSGIRNIEPSHCKVISDFITAETKKCISETTVKRFFGFAHKKHNFSSFTLNGLAQFAGYESWKMFCSKAAENSLLPSSKAWEDIRNKAGLITDFTLKTIRNHSGIPFSFTVERNFAHIDFEQFLQSDAHFTCFSAQAGGGKSVLLAHLVEHFFIQEKAPYKDYTVLFINANSLMSIYGSGLSLDFWLAKELGLGESDGFRNYFMKNRTEKHDKLLLVIDGLDSSSLQKNIVNNIVEFLCSNDSDDSVKLVLGMRITVWIQFLQNIMDSAFLSQVCFKGNYPDRVRLSNIPFLNPKEILSIIGSIEGEEVKPAAADPDLMSLLKYPSWMQFYYQLKQEGRDLSYSNCLTFYELVYSFIQKKIFLDKDSTGKIHLLTRIVKQMQIHGSGHKIPKKILLPEISMSRNVYEELILKGVLREEKRIDNIRGTELVSFIHPCIYEYFIFCGILEKFNHAVGKNLFAYVFKKRMDNVNKVTLLKWTIRYCVNTNDFTALKLLLTLRLTAKEKDELFLFLCSTITHELSFKKSRLFTHDHDEADLIDIFVKYDFINPEFKQTIQALIDVSERDESLIRLFLIRGCISLIEFDKESLFNCLSELKKHKAKIEHIFPVNPYECLLFLYKKLNGEEIGNDILLQIKRFCANSIKNIHLKNNPVKANEILSYRLAIGVLQCIGKEEESIRFISAIRNLHPAIFYYRGSWFSNYLLISLGCAYAKSGQQGKAIRIYSFICTMLATCETLFFTDYVKIEFAAFKAEFYKYRGELDKALTNVNEALMLSKKYNYAVLYVFFGLFKIDILKVSQNYDDVFDLYYELSAILEEKGYSLNSFSLFNELHFFNTNRSSGLINIKAS